MSALAAIRREGLPPSVTGVPVHCSGAIVCELRKALPEAGPIAWNHGDGRHSFIVEIGGARHRVTVEPVS